MTDVHEGGCVCGDVRYRVTGDPVIATVCHCRFCQKRTGSAFSQPVVFKLDQVVFSGGPLATYEHRSDESGRWLRMQFCTRCGTTVCWTAERRPGSIGISGGTLDDPDWVSERRHIWVRSKQKAIVIPADAQCFEMGTPV
jgi:hypothetical protein